MVNERKGITAMMLKDQQGRTVLIRSEWTQNRTQIYEFHARDGLNLLPVEEAIVFEGDDVFLTEDQVSDMLVQAGFPGLAFIIDLDQRRHWNPVVIQHDSGWDGNSWVNLTFSGRSQQVFHIEGKTVDEATFNRFQEVYRRMGDFNGFQKSVSLQKGLALSILKIMELIGVGKVVTSQSLLHGYAKGENRPRLLPGDTVKVAIRGKEEVLGVIKSMKSTVTVLRQDGVKMTCAFDRIKRTDDIGFNSGLADQTEPTILENFKQTIEAGKKRIFRVKLEKGDFVFPMFPDTDRWGRPERQISRAGILSCVCPICGWRMADVYDNSEFICCYCRITGMVICRSDTEVSLLMARMPGKNRFAIKEARCCGNCGRFEFEVGRQGKRSTGYCPTANQCLQAFNVCDLWYPREASRYESNMRQHTTNLHYGVSDGRNTNRNDIRDTVYTEADHKLECARADKAKIAYANAYQRFMNDLRGLAEQTLLVEEMTPELMEEWKKVLDDPC